MSEKDFYEGKFVKTSRKSFKRRLAWWTYALKRDRMVEKYIGNGKILDIGCGGGKEILSDKGDVVGIDVSKASLKNAIEVYTHVVLADLNYLPFKDGIFDYVVSIDVLGHIPIPQKDKCLSEIKRVMKDAAVTLHYIEADSQSSLSKKFKEYESLYFKYFIEQDGHFGLEKPTAIKKRFMRFFKDVQLEHGYSQIPLLGEYSKRLDNEYKHKKLLFKILVIIDEILKNKFVSPLSLIAITPIYHIWEYIHPIDEDDGVFIITSKK